jgi:hypothetical protein
MTTHYGNIPCTFYRDFETWKELEPSSGGIGGPITYGRNSTATYIGSNGYLQTASANQPRFGYEYDSGGNLVYRGLLVESAGGNNYFLYSEDFSQANWTKTSCSVNSVSVTNPDGTTSGQKIAKSSNGGSISQSYTTNYTNASATVRGFHLSVMAKAAECGYLLMTISNGTDNMYCYYDLNAGTVGANGGDINNLVLLYKHITNMGNGWYRCFLAIRDDNLTNKTYTFNYIPTTTSTGQTINNSGDGAYLWGAMAHYEPNFSIAYNQTAKSYIKTTSSTVTSNFAESLYVGYLTDNRYVSRFLGSYNNNKISLFGQFSAPYNLKTGIVQAYMGIGISPTSLYFRQLGTNCNLLFRATAGTFDFGSFAILDNNNKGIVTYGVGLGSTGCMNNGTIYSSSALSLAVVNPIYAIGFNGDAYYKKVFCMPTILNNSQLSRLTTL